jgi:hypothetical protein
MKNSPYFFKILNRELISSNFILEVIFYFQTEKVFHNQLRVDDTIVELQKMKNSYEKKDFFRGYPFICSCGDGECTGIFLEISGDRVYFSTSLIDKEWNLGNRESVKKFIKYLVEFFINAKKDLCSFK